MSRLRFVDPWDPDDPALQRGREGLASALQNRAEPVHDAPRAAKDPEPVPEAAPAPVEPVRNRVGELVGRVQAGDLSAVDALRRLLDR